MKHFLLYPALLLLLTRCGADDDHQAAEKKPRLLSVAMSQQRSDGTFWARENRKFFYAGDGRLEREEYASYESGEDKLHLRWTDVFTYADNRVSRIDRTYAEAEQTATTRYTYDNSGRVSVIHIDDSTDTQITVTYEKGDTVNALYEENGSSFVFRMAMEGDNLVYSKTLDASLRMINETYNEYDDKVNPYNLLGFMDMHFKNASHNNRTSQRTTYYSPEHPSSTPYGHEYRYINGLPVKQTIRYKSPDTGEHNGVLQWEFEYEE